MLKPSEIWALLVPTGDKPDAVFQQQLFQLGEAHRAAYKTNIPLALIISLAFSYWVSLTTALSWFALAFIFQTANAYNAARFVSLHQKNVTLRGPELRQWVARFAISIFFYHSSWSLCLYLFWVDGAVDNNLFLLTIIALSLTPTILLNRSSLTNFFTSISVLSVFFATALFWHDVATKWPILAAYSIFATSLIGFAIRLNKGSHREIVLSHEKTDLINALSKSMEESNSARARAEEASRAKSQFLANMSHELRTPLNAIIGFSEVMNREVFGALENEKYKQYSSDIHNSGQHLLELINDVLDLSKIEAGQYTIHTQRVDLTSIADDCQRLVELQAKTNELSIARSFVDPLPNLEADERALRQIWLNLLTNAVKFSPRSSAVHLVADYTDTGAFFIGVSDKGPGIPQHELAKVLETFGQGTEGTSRPGSGTGLGLSIVKGLTEAHGGEFILESEVGLGTRAIAVFPKSSVIKPEICSDTYRQRAVSYP